MLFEASVQHHSYPSSASQTPTHASPHVKPFDSVSSPRLGHFERWSENLRDLSKIGHIGSSGAQNGATYKEGSDEKAYLSTDTENEAKRDVRTRRREGKRRRRKAEIYVRFVFLRAAWHRPNRPTDHSPYFVTYLSPDVHSEACAGYDDVRRPDTSPSSSDTGHRACPRYLAVVPIPP